MQYICSEKPVFLLKKANAVPLAKSPHCIRIVFANAPYCVFSLTTHLSVMLNLFNFVQFAHARHSSSKFGSALAQSQMSASVRGDVLEMARCEILKQVQDDICVLIAHRSSLITHCS